MVKAWQNFFGQEKKVTILHGDLTTTCSDAIISPANSFGFMDGGVDYAISMRLGWDLQIELQNQIKALPEMELLIGKALILETKDEIIPYLIAAPTMRVPMNFNVSTSINAYLAMKAALIAAKNHPKIESIAIPGLCTGIGKMKPQIAARQMLIAFLEIEHGKRMDFKNFGRAQSYHVNINPEGLLYQ